MSLNESIVEDAALESFGDQACAVGHGPHIASQGMAGFVLANGSMSSNQSGDCNARSARSERATNSQGLGSQRDIRRALIKADLVDYILDLPGQLSKATTSKAKKVDESPCEV